VIGKSYWLRCPRCARRAPVVTDGDGHACIGCFRCGYSAIPRRQPTRKERLNPRKGEQHGLVRKPREGETKGREPLFDDVATDLQERITPDA
jgi:hypothetical protein